VIIMTPVRWLLWIPAGETRNELGAAFANSESSLRQVIPCRPAIADELVDDGCIGPLLRPWPSMPSGPVEVTSCRGLRPAENNDRADAACHRHRRKPMPRYDLYVGPDRDTSRRRFIGTGEGAIDHHAGRAGSDRPAIIREKRMPTVRR